MNGEGYSVATNPDRRTLSSRSSAEKSEVNGGFDSSWLGDSPLAQHALQERSEDQTKAEPKVEEPVSLKVKLLRWLFPDISRRRAKRYAVPGLVAYYWTGGAPYSYSVGDMSATGLYLLTKERWAPGTLIQMTLQRQDGVSNGADGSICVMSEVIRWGENGAGFNFVLSDYEDVIDHGIMPGEATDRRSVERFLQRLEIPGWR
jgi:hypothetical protein